jgi:hypothetical protein
MKFTELIPVEKVILSAIEHHSMSIHALSETTGICKLTLAKKLISMKRRKLLGVQRGIVYSGCGELIDAFLDGRGVPKKSMRERILAKLRKSEYRRKDLVFEIGNKYAQLIDDVGCRLVYEGLIEKERGVWRLRK